MDDFMKWAATIMVPDNFRKEGFILANGTKYCGFQNIERLISSLISENIFQKKRADDADFDANLSRKVMEKIADELRDHGVIKE